jgi:hypothetical protein
MATKAQASGAIAPLVIMIVLLAAIVFYVITIPPAEREQLIGNLTTTSYARTVLDVSPGLISGLTETGVARIYRTLSTVDVDNTPQAQTRALSTQMTILRSMTHEEIGNFTFDVADKAKLGYVNAELLVTDKLGSGSLIVAVNSRVVFSGNTEVGQNVRVALPVDSIIQGTNSLKFYVSSPGWKFWSKNSYTFTNVNLVLASYTEESAAQAQTFSFTASELTGAQSAKLTASIKQISEASAELKLMLNGVEIYKATPAQITSLSVDLPMNVLSGTNTLQWSVGKDGAYSVVLGQVTLTTTKFEGGEAKNYGFTLTSSENTKLAAHTLKCELKMTMTPVATSSEGEELPPPPPTGGAVVSLSAINVRINGVLTQYIFSSTNAVTDDVCKYLHSGSNTVSLSAENDIIIDSLTLKVSSK